MEWEFDLRIYPLKLIVRIPRVKNSLTAMPCGCATPVLGLSPGDQVGR